MTIHLCSDGILYETYNRFASQYEPICLLAVVGYSALGAHCYKIADLVSKSFLALTLFFFTDVDHIDIGVIRNDRFVIS